MNDVKINSIRFLRSACSDLTIAEINEVISKLETIIEDIKAKEAQEALEKQKTAEVISNIKAMMDEAGITPDDLNRELRVQHKATQKRTVVAKYSFTDEEGNTLTWTGQGKTPRAFIQCMEREGKQMSDYIINNEG